MAQKKTRTSSKTAMEVLVAYMKSHPKAVYADAQAACQKAGRKVFPIMWGRAQVLLGRVPQRRKKKRAQVQSGSVWTATKRGPGRPRKVARTAGLPVPIHGPADLGVWQDLVAKLNGGGRVVLQFDGEQWNLVNV